MRATDVSDTTARRPDASAAEAANMRTTETRASAAETRTSAAEMTATAAEMATTTTAANMAAARSRQGKFSSKA